MIMGDQVVLTLFVQLILTTNYGTLDELTDISSRHVALDSGRRLLWHKLRTILLISSTVLPIETKRNETKSSLGDLTTHHCYANRLDHVWVLDYLAF